MMTPESDENHGTRWDNNSVTDVARLDPEVRAHRALLLKVDTYEGREPVASWRRPPGHPRNVWLNKVQEDANALPLSTLRRSEIVRGHGTVQQSTRTTR